MIEFDNIQHGYAIANTAGCTFNYAVDKCISRSEGGRLLGGVIYQNYTGESIAMHVASFAPRWINKDLIWTCFHYPFNQLGVNRIFGQVPESNKEALNFDLKLGFKIVTKIDGVFADGGAYVLKMERGECRWTGVKPSLVVSNQG